MNDIEFEIISRANKYESEHFFCYGECEEIAWDIAFPKGHKIIKREEDNDYHGETRIDIESDGKLYHCEYGWGSCSSCDTLKGEGHVEAIKMILEAIKPVNILENQQSERGNG
jgi:hypothetical protein